jgi:predicted AAA+ superfamily ATPase
MYHTRHIQQKLDELSNYFKVILVKGARQVGKSTMLKKVFPNLKCIVFDPIQDLYGARSDPDLFLDNFPAPIILDEIQYAPELLAALKRRVDESDKKGQYFLTGSQNLSVMKGIAESLAGRVGILHLENMTLDEMANTVVIDDKLNWLELYLRTPDQLPSLIVDDPSQEILYEHLWRGAFPGIMEMKDQFIPDYYSSYLQTYIERDVRQLENIKDLNQFSRFVALSAALTAQEINYSQLGREIGISPATANEWLNILNYTFQWREVWPYSGNIIKRISKKSKGYITDTGFACYLQRISSPTALAAHPLLGALFETWVVNNISKFSGTIATMPQMYHWRTNGGAEVDLILEFDGAFYPIEIKCKTTVQARDLTGINSFRTSYPHLKIMPGLLIYAGKTCYKLPNNIIALPWNAKAVGTA